MDAVTLDLTSFRSFPLHSKKLEKKEKEKSLHITALYNVDSVQELYGARKQSHGQMGRNFHMIFFLSILIR